MQQIERRPLPAVAYAYGPWLCEVELTGDISHERQLHEAVGIMAARRRRILRMTDATRFLTNFVVLHAAQPDHAVEVLADWHSYPWPATLPNQLDLFRNYMNTLTMQWSPVRDKFRVRFRKGPPDTPWQAAYAISSRHVLTLHDNVEAAWLATNFTWEEL
jgi:hypothetical protein